MCPPHFPTDRECIEKILATCGRADLTECTVARIRNTMELGRMQLSENLLGRLSEGANVTVCGSAKPIEFNALGQLAGELPVRAAA